MKVRFTPVYRDLDGDEFVFLDKNFVFETEAEATDFYLDHAGFQSLRQGCNLTFTRVMRYDFDEKGHCEGAEYFQMPQMTETTGMVLVGGPLFAHWTALQERIERGEQPTQEELQPPTPSPETLAAAAAAIQRVQSTVEAISEVAAFSSSVTGNRSTAANALRRLADRLESGNTEQVTGPNRDEYGATAGCDCPVCQMVRSSKGAAVTEKRTLH